MDAAAKSSPTFSDESTGRDGCIPWRDDDDDDDDKDAFFILSFVDVLVVVVLVGVAAVVRVEWT
jgi:hypothetical protein